MAATNHEGQFLSAILQDNEFIPTARTLVSPGMMKDQNNKLIYEKAIELYKVNGYVDRVAIADNLNNLQAEVALRNLDSLKGALTEDRLKSYAKELIRKSQIGKLKQLGENLQEEVKSQSTVSDNDLKKIVEKVHMQLFELAGDTTFSRPTKSQVMEEMKKDMLLYAGRELMGFDTGWETLNQITRGIGPEQLWVIGAYTSIGKSWFSLKLASNLAHQGVKVLYLSTEMSEKRLYWRLATILTKMPEVKLIFDNMDLTDSAHRNAALHKIEALPIEIRSGISDVNDAMFEIRKAKMQGQCDVVVIDFLQNLASGKDEYQEITNAVVKLQNLASREKVAIILASQNNRESQKSDFESLYGFKGSGAIEQAADIAIVLSRHKDNKQKYLLCDVMKNRNGMTGQMIFAIDLKTGQFKDKGYYEKEEPLPEAIPDYPYGG